MLNNSTEDFEAKAFPFLDAVYADAFCLTGNQPDAVDLVVTTYVRAFHSDKASPKPGCLWKRHGCAWLCRQMHITFCDPILTQTRDCKTSLGGRP